MSFKFQDILALNEKWMERQKAVSELQMCFHLVATVLRYILCELFKQQVQSLRCGVCHALYVLKVLGRPSLSKRITAG